MNVILNNLTQGRLITQSEETTLRNAGGSRLFLAALIQIYETKTNLYLTACQFGIKKTLQAEGVTNQIEAKTIEKTMECAYNIFLQLDKFSCLSSLRLLLTSAEPSLLASLGFKTLSESGDSLQEVARRIFVGYVARYSLFKSVDAAALERVCNEASREAPLLFSNYLLNAFRLESQFSADVKNRLQGQPASQAPSILAQYVRTNSRIIHECIKGIIFYLGTLADYPTLSPAVRDRYFYHLSNHQRSLGFAEEIAEGYVQQMQEDANQRSVIQANAEALLSTASGVCLPALKILRISVDIDFSALNTGIQEIRNAIQRNETERAAIDSQFAAAKQEANRQIDQRRASIPERPVTFGVQVGFNF